jgi:hypothetical protein
MFMVSDPFSQINLNNILKAKHGSHTRIYDIDENFWNDRFEEMRE